jgi:hypothetical protein
MSHTRKLTTINYKLLLIGAKIHQWNAKMMKEPLYKSGKASRPNRYPNTHTIHNSKHTHTHTKEMAQTHSKKKPTFTRNKCTHKVGNSQKCKAITP